MQTPHGLHFKIPYMSQKNSFGLLRNDDSRLNNPAFIPLSANPNKHKPKLIETQI